MVSSRMHERVIVWGGGKTTNSGKAISLLWLLSIKIFINELRLKNPWVGFCFERSRSGFPFVCEGEVDTAGL